MPKVWSDEDLARIASQVSLETIPFAEQPAPRAIEGVSALDLAHLTLKLGYKNEQDGPSKAIDFLSNCQLQLERTRDLYYKTLLPTYQKFRDEALTRFQEIAEVEPPPLGDFTSHPVILRHFKLRTLKFKGVNVSGQNLFYEWLHSLDEQLQSRYASFVAGEWPKLHAYEAMLRFSLWRDEIAHKNQSKNTKNLKRGGERRVARKS